MSAHKSWLSLDKQKELLISRGMCAHNESSWQTALEHIGYYRLSGYWKYYQQEPGAYGREPFIPGTSLDQILGIYRAEQQLNSLLMPKLLELEVYLRTRFAYECGKRSTTGDLLSGSLFVDLPREDMVYKLTSSVEGDLDRSTEAYMSHYAGEQRSRDYTNLPLWIAVEALSFGTLSRIIGANREEIAYPLADKLKVSREDFPGQIRAITKIRNRIAHGNRLWNVKNDSMPAVAKTWKRQSERAGYPLRRSKKMIDSMYVDIFVLDKLHSYAGLGSFLNDEVHPLLEQNPVLKLGICDPVDMHRRADIQRFLLEHNEA